MSKKLKYILVLIVMMCIHPDVDAASLKVSCPTSVYVGDSISCTVTAYNSSLSGVQASVSFSGMKYSSVSNKTGSAYFVADKTTLDGVFDEASKSKTLAKYVFKATKKGTATISVDCANMAGGESLDFAELDCTGASASIKIKEHVVVEEPTTTETTTKKKTTKPTEPKKEETKKEDPKPSDTTIKDLSVEGYTLNIVDGKYTLSVDNTVETITINATPTSTESSVSGTGEKVLKVGENEFTITITGKDKTTSNYTLVVNRKDVVNPVEPEPEKESNNIFFLILAGVLLVIGFIVVLLKKGKKQTKKSKRK